MRALLGCPGRNCKVSWLRPRLRGGVLFRIADDLRSNGARHGPKRIVWRQTVPAAVDWQGNLMKETVTSYRLTQMEPDLSRGSLQVLEKSGGDDRTRTESSARSH